MTRWRRVPDRPTTSRLAPMGQIYAQSLTVVSVRHERLAVAVVTRTLAHVLKTGLVVHSRVDLRVAGLEDGGAQPVAQPEGY